MHDMRRIIGALFLPAAFVCAAIPVLGEPGKISIGDWAKTGEAKADTTVEASPEPGPNEPKEPVAKAAAADSTIPPEALLPAVEPPESALSPEPDPAPDAALVKTGVPATAIDPERQDAEGSPESARPTPGDVKSVNDWVAQAAAAPVAATDESDTPEPNTINGVIVPPATQVRAGQVRTGAGTIDLNSINLDKLHEELKKAVPPREELRMSMQEAVQLALSNNRDIIVTSYEPLKVDGDIMQAKGEFDPVLSGKYAKSSVESKASSQISSFTGGLGSSSSLLGGGNSNVLGNVLRSINRINLRGDDESNNSLGLGRLLLTGALTLVSSAGNTVRNFLNPGDQEFIIEQDSNTYETTLQGKIPWGTQYQVKMSVVEEKSTYSNNESEFSGGLTLSITQPLLRGRGPKANLARIRIAKNSREIAENQLMSQVMTTVSDVVKAYWDLVGAEQQLIVRETSLENAQRLMDVNQRRLDIGIGAALEVVQAKASVAQRTSDVIAARNQVGIAEDRLKLLLDLKENEEFSNKRIVAADAPEAKELDLDEQASVSRAFENRPELKSAELEIDSAELDRYRAANNMQMKLDVSGSVFQGARGDDAGTVFDGVSSRDDNSYSLQIDGEIPITNRAARGQYMKALQSKRQAKDRLYKTKSEIAINVRNAIRQAASSRIIVESSGQARSLQETNVSAEEKRLKLGISTSFEVLRTQEDLANAHAQEVQAKIDYEKALTDLKLAEGTILAALNVEYGAPEPEKPVGFVRSLVPPVPADE
ncbi:MAG: TolC family protein [Candidatus Hydrogenedentes bacterium]|nr:TolC family protein [Candidatus Hydrogenedentota bacterium]